MPDGCTAQRKYRANKSQKKQADERVRGAGVSDSCRVWAEPTNLALHQPKQAAAADRSGLFLTMRFSLQTQLYFLRKTLTVNAPSFTAPQTSCPESISVYAPSSCTSTASRRLFSRKRYSVPSSP